MTIKGLMFRLEQIRYIQRVFRRMSRYLDIGGYCLQNNMRSLVRKKDKKVYSRYFRDEPKEGIWGLMIKILNAFNFFCIKKDASVKLGTYGALYIANNNDCVREIKLLDAVNGNVKVFFTDIHTKTDYIELYNELSGMFRMPKIRSNEHTDDNSLVISLIRKEEGFSDLDAIRSICSAHIHQLERISRLNLQHIEKIEPNLNADDVSCESKSLVERIKMYMSKEVFQERYIFCLQHGDLSADNLMYGEVDKEVDYWWIDWEHVGNRVFFYDVYFYILNNAVADKNYIPTQNFLSGLYDDELERLFSAAGHKYLRNKRKEYFIRFAIDFINERLSAERIKGAVEQYSNYFDKYFC